MKAGESKLSSQTINVDFSAGEAKKGVEILEINPDGSYNFLISDSEIKDLLSDLFNGMTILEFSIEVGDPIRDYAPQYISGTGEKDGVTHELAAMLTDSDDRLPVLAFAGVGDSCTGAPCNTCKLVGKLGDQWCSCEGSGPDGTPGHCNHSTYR